jgi:hypothetical protein
MPQMTALIARSPTIQNSAMNVFMESIFIIAGIRSTAETPQIFPFAEIVRAVIDASDASISKIKNSTFSINR